MKIVANELPISTSTVCARRGSGALNAGTPFETASVPVSATDPEANARRISSNPSPCVPAAAAQPAGAV
jgi:hypothetical protein